jgi:protein SCO1/2
MKPATKRPVDRGPTWRSIAATLVAAVVLAGLALTPPGSRMLAWLGETLAPRPAVGGPFSLIDQRGQRRTEKDFAGRPMLLVFGFTHCPDVCPTTLAAVSRWMEALGADANRVAALFVTVDPERDTPATLSDYMQAFDPRIVALTGTPEEVASMLKTFRAFARKTSTGDFEHTAAVYLLDGDGALLQLIDYAQPDETILAALRGALAGHGG